MINPSYWLALPWETRLKLADAFEMKKLTGTIVEDNRVVEDGYTKALYPTFTIERMQEFTGLKSKDVYELFQACVDKVEGKQPEPTEEEPVKKTRKK